MVALGSLGCFPHRWLGQKGSQKARCDRVARFILSSSVLCLKHGWDRLSALFPKIYAWGAGVYCLSSSRLVQGGFPMKTTEMVSSGGRWRPLFVHSPHSSSNNKPLGLELCM